MPDPQAQESAPEAAPDARGAHALRAWALGIAAWAILSAAAWVAADRGYYEIDGLSTMAGILHLPDAKSGALPLYKYYFQPLSYEAMRVIYVALGNAAALWRVPALFACAGIALLFAGLRMAHGKTVAWPYHAAAIAVVPELFYTALYLNTTALGLPFLAASVCLIYADGARPRGEIASTLSGLALAAAFLFRFEFGLAGPLLLVLTLGRPEGLRRAAWFSGATAAALLLAFAAGLIRPSEIRNLANEQAFIIMETMKWTPRLTADAVASLFSPFVWLLLAAGAILHWKAAPRLPRWQFFLFLATLAPFVFLLRYLTTPKYLVPVLAFVPIFLSSAMNLAAGASGAWRRFAPALACVAVVSQFLSFDPAALQISASPRPVFTHDGSRSYGAYLACYARVALRPNRAHNESYTILRAREIADALAASPRGSVLVYREGDWFWKFFVHYFLPVCMEEKGYKFKLTTGEAKYIELVRGEHRVVIFLENERAWAQKGKKIGKAGDVAIVLPRSYEDEAGISQMWDQIDKLREDGGRYPRFRLAISQSALGNDGELSISGWVLNPLPIARAAVMAGERKLGDAEFPLRRPDVAARYPEFGTDRAGFKLQAKLPPGASLPESLALHFLDKDGGLIRAAAARVPAAGAAAEN